MGGGIRRISSDGFPSVKMVNYWNDIKFHFEIASFVSPGIVKRVPMPAFQFGLHSQKKEMLFSFARRRPLSM